ncbi:MAG: hypothetical protein ACFFD4_23010 [Candidatus Odinarchaeota archaeon]
MENLQMMLTGMTPVPAFPCRAACSERDPIAACFHLENFNDLVSFLYLLEKVFLREISQLLSVLSIFS